MLYLRSSKKEKGKDGGAILGIKPEISTHQYLSYSIGQHLMWLHLVARRLEVCSRSQLPCAKLQLLFSTEKHRDRYSVETSSFSHDNSHIVLKVVFLGNSKSLTLRSWPGLLDN